MSTELTALSTALNELAKSSPMILVLIVIIFAFYHMYKKGISTIENVYKEANAQIKAAFSESVTSLLTINEALQNMLKNR